MYGRVGRLDSGCVVEKGKLVRGLAACRAGAQAAILMGA
jgi:hypothetical protein